MSAIVVMVLTLLREVLDLRVSRFIGNGGEIVFFSECIDCIRHLNSIDHAINRQLASNSFVCSREC